MRNEDLYPCPYCRSEQVWLIKLAHDPPYQVHCLTCGADGPRGESTEAAGQRYNAVARLLAERQAAKLKP